MNTPRRAPGQPTLVDGDEPQDFRERDRGEREIRSAQREGQPPPGIGERCGHQHGQRGGPPRRNVVTGLAESDEIGAETDEGGVPEADLAVPPAEYVPGCRPPGEEQDRDGEREIRRKSVRIDDAESEQSAEPEKMPLHTRLTVRPNNPSGRRSRTARKAMSP